MRLDAHNYRKRVESCFLKLEKKETISGEDKELLKKFRDFLVSEAITYGRINKYIPNLVKFSEQLGKRFRDANEEDIRRIVATIEANERYSPWTKRDFKLTLRKFFTWLRGTKEYPPEVAWLRVHTKIKCTKTYEDMLTEEEVKRLISYARNIQDRALISVLYDSGCRIGELIYLKINQVRFDEYGAQLFVSGKTGFRRVRVVACAPYLLEWINKHPLKDDPKAFLWINRRLEPYSYGAIAVNLYRIARRAGISKKVNPHNFRHSRATYLANHLTEAQMKEHFGWMQDSKMAATYVHLSGRNVDSALLKVYGIETNGQKHESVLKPKDCLRCGETNQVTNKFCQKCGLPLDQTAISEIVQKDLERGEADKVLDSLLQDEEFREMFVRKISQVVSG